MLIVEYVGIRSALGVKRQADAVSASLSDPAMLPYASPWSEGELGRIAFKDFMHHEPPTGTRSEAMRIPAVARARNLLVSTGCRLPLRSYRRDVLRPDADTPFLYTTGDTTSWQHRAAWTIDDLIFYGASLWKRVNSESTGFPLAANRVNQADWTVNSDNRIEVDGVVQKDNDVILITGLHEGILTFGIDALRDTRDLYRIVRDRLENPVPGIDLHQTEGEDLPEQERKSLVESWKTARKARGGGAVAYSNKAIEVRELGTGAGSDLLIEARNAASLDLARVVGVGASRIDATAPKASLNYETTTGRNQELIDFDLALYLTPFAARLSADDVVPAGTRVAHDYTELAGLAPSLTGPVTED